MRSITPEIIQNKHVLIRIDTDVPIKDNSVLDDSRLLAVLPTLQLLQTHAQSITILGHLGRPQGQVVPELSLRPIATRLTELLHEQVSLHNLSEAGTISSKFRLLENLRFDPREEEPSVEFAQQLAQAHDLFVFEAFAVAHRASTSTTIIPQFLPAYAGLRIVQEVTELSRILQSPEHPFLAIIGGAKIETKLPTVEKLQSLADHLFVGGKLPHEIKSQGLQFPANVQVATMNSSGLDIDELSTTQLLDQVKSAKLIVWNGPLGKFEDPTAQAGTQALCAALKASSAYKVIGGGETINAVNTFHTESSINFISVGGGAMLEFLSGKELPAIAALSN